MWEETLIESNKNTQRPKAWWIFLVSAAVHGLVAIGIVVTSYWTVEAIEGPKSIQTFLVTESISVPPAPGSRQGTAIEKQAAKHEERGEQIVPEANSETKENEVAESGQVSDDPDSGPAGDPRGVPGGDPNSAVWAPAVGVGQEEAPITITAEVQEPVLIRRVEPVYPPLAIRMRIEGVVILQAVITKTGTVEEMKVLRSDHEILKTAAITAVEQWLYTPAMLNHHPVKVYFNVTVQFHLN